MTATLPPAAEERCPRSDLYPSQCGHCRGHTGPPVSPNPVAIVRRWKARYPGHCGWCGEDFEPGDDLGRDENDELVCWRCLP